MPLKPPISVWTPPVSILHQNRPKPASKPNSNPKPASGAKPSGAKPSGGSAKPSNAQSSAVQIPSYESIFSEMLKRYLPETVEFTPLSEREISNMIANWLRPAYEQAIRARQTQTRHFNAELDADAWSRGMGSSTYVTDVKSRAFRDEAQDVDDLESDYASTLAGHLYDAMRAQQEQKVEIDRFNAEQINHAREQAASAATALYNAYLTAANQSSGGKSRSTGKQTASAAQSVSALEALLSLPGQEEYAEISYTDARSLLSRMTNRERAALYAGADPDAARQKAEIIHSLGSDAYNRLKAQFPA